MVREVCLNELDETLEELDYSVDRDRARAQLGEVVVACAEGTEPLPAVLDRIETDSVASRGERSSEGLNLLPVEAVGEPGRSEGEG